MTTEQMITDLAVQVGTIRQTLWAIGKRPELSMAASHMAGTICGLLQVCETRLLKLSGNYK